MFYAKEVILCLALCISMLKIVYGMILLSGLRDDTEIIGERAYELCI